MTDPELEPAPAPEAQPAPAIPELDDEARAKLRAKAIRRLRKLLEEWKELRYTSPLGEHTTVKLRDVDKYNDALNKLRQAGETVKTRYYVTGPVIPAGTNHGQKHDGIPLHALRGPARAVLLLFDREPAPDASAVGGHSLRESEQG